VREARISVILASCLFEGLRLQPTRISDQGDTSRDDDPGTTSEMGEQQPQIPLGQSYTALRRLVSRACDVHEDCASLAAYARVSIVIEHDDDVIEMVVSPESLGAGRIRVSNGAVIIPIARGIAPAIIGPDGAHGERAGRAAAATVSTP
jgi:hypothetical protein